MPLKKIKRFKQLITKGYKWRIKSEIWIRSSEYNRAKIESQIENLKATESEKIYQEKFTGTTTERPEFQKLLSQLKKDDTLIVTKLDRFAKNTREALEIIQHLFQNDIKVHILNMGISDNTPTGQLIFTIFSAFAFELKKQGITYKMIEGKTGVSIAIQKKKI